MNTDDSLLLDNQLCFALYSASLAMTQRYKQHLDQFGLTYSQYTIMLILWEQNGVSLKTIADKLGQKSGSLTPVIKRMEADGWIKRVRGLKDERALSIQLTSKGSKLKNEAKNIHRCIAEACGLASNDIQRLKSQLITLKNDISK